MQVIVKPILSEKMTALTDKQNRVAFVVSKAANKLEIKRAVEAMYSVTVKSVNLVTRKQVLFPVEPLPSRKQL